MPARMDSRIRRWPLAAVLSAVMGMQGQTVSGAAADAQTSDPGPAAMRALSSKLQLLGRLVHGDQLVSRITASDDDEAKNILTRAQELWQLADASFATGDNEAAGNYASEGLAAITAVSRRVVDTGRKASEDRTRYENMRKRVLDFSEAFQRVVHEKPDQAVAGLLNPQEVTRLLNEAERYAGNDDYTYAIEHLTHASDLVETALAKARHRDTLLHELKFNTSEDEYNYEKQRNMSYRMLVDMLEREKADNQEGLEKIRAAVEENTRIREEAEGLVQDGDVRAAISKLEEGTDTLARVLRMSGLVF
ncbi:MAG: hypothetical protein WBO37_10155 [Gammaproteobacteria bacterium]